VSPPYARRPSPVARPGASCAVILRHPELERLFKPPLAPLRAPPRAPPRHCRRRTELELAARARRRPTTLVAPSGPSTPPQLAYCPTHRLLATFPRAAVVTAAGRRWSSPPANSPPPLRFPATPRWACGPPQPLARPGSPPARRIWLDPRRPPRSGTQLRRFKFV
jgi:hypothetical protein